MPQYAIWQPNPSCSDFSKPIRHHSPFYLCPVQTWQLFHMLLREVFQLIRLRTCGQARCDDSLHATCLPRTRSGNWVRYDGMTWCCLRALGKMPMECHFWEVLNCFFLHAKTFGHHGICTICSSVFVMPEVFTSRRGLVWAKFESDVALALLETYWKYLPPIMVCCVYRIL